MSEVTKEQLLKNKRVQEEISRHQWIESEKAGQDIGFERAAEDWLTNFSKVWMDYHMPGISKNARQSKLAAKPDKSSKKVQVKSKPAVKRVRSGKSASKAR
jgi:hypothetical protein